MSDLRSSLYGLKLFVPLSRLPCICVLSPLCSDLMSCITFGPVSPNLRRIRKRKKGKFERIEVLGLRDRVNYDRYGDWLLPFIHDNLLVGLLLLPLGLLVSPRLRLRIE